MVMKFEVSEVLLIVLATAVSVKVNNLYALDSAVLSPVVRNGIAGAPSRSSPESSALAR